MRFYGYHESTIPWNEDGNAWLPLSGSSMPILVVIESIDQMLLLLNRIRSAISGLANSMTMNSQ